MCVYNVTHSLLSEPSITYCGNLAAVLYSFVFFYWPFHIFYWSSWSAAFNFIAMNYRKVYLLSQQLLLLRMLDSITKLHLFLDNLNFWDRAIDLVNLSLCCSVNFHLISLNIDLLEFCGFFILPGLLFVFSSCPIHGIYIVYFPLYSGVPVFLRKQISL